MKIEIKSRWTGTVLFSVETESWRLAVEAAAKGGADLSGADLRGAYLSGAYLSGAYLSGACLSGADLRGAYLRGAYLSGADLRGAYLSGAYLRGADLRGAYLRGADLSGAIGITPKVLQILGSRHNLIVYQYGKVKIGCRSKTLEWWEKNYQKAGAEEGYSQTEIEEYAEHIASARKFMERYQLLVEPKADEAVGA